ASCAPAAPLALPPRPNAITDARFGALSLLSEPWRTMSKFNGCADDTSCATGATGVRAHIQRVRVASTVDESTRDPSGNAAHESSDSIVHFAGALRGNAVQRLPAHAAILLP